LPYPKNIALRLQEVIAKVEKIANQDNCGQKSVQILAVSKKHPSSAIAEAYQNGQRIFAESYLSEALEKMEKLKELDIEWHFIGPIQSNKTRKIAENFNWVQSVDRLKIAQRLAEQRPEQLPPLNVCIQINAFNESTKSGASIEELEQIAAFCDEHPHIALRGIMAIPPKQADRHKQMEQFVTIQNIYQKLKEHYPTLDTLSMGMSADMEAAIACGSNCVRIGTAIFGARDYD